MSANMKTTKRTETMVETFEKMIVQLKQRPPKVLCEDCRQEVSKLPITKIALIQTVSEKENVYLFKTDSGVCFFRDVGRQIIRRVWKTLLEATRLIYCINQSGCYYDDKR